MTTIDSGIFILLIEALAILTAGCGLLMFFAAQRAHRRKTLMIDLVHRLKNAGGQRLVALEAQIKQKTGLDDEQVRTVAQQVLAAETHFYQYLVKALLQVDDRQLIELDREVEALTDSIAKAAPLAVEAPAAATNHAATETVAQLLGTIEKNHAQVLTEIKKSAETIRTGLTSLQVVPAAAVAIAASAGAPVKAAPAAPAAAAEHELEALPDIEEAASAADAGLESLPDIEDNSAAGLAPTPEPEVAAPEEAPATKESFEQIAEMPDDLLSFDAPEPAAKAAPPAPAAVAAPQPDLDIAELALADLDAGIAATPAPAPTAKPTATAMPPPAAPAPAASVAMSADDIDALLGSVEPAAPATKPAPSPAKADESASIDEMYANEPLIPEPETEIAEKPADNSNKAPNSGAAAPAASNVDDLLAELDALLK